MTDTDILLVLIVWIVCALGSYLIAAQKGDPSPGTWAVAGFLLGPLGLLATGVFAKPHKPN